MTHVRPELRVEIRKLGNRYQAITRAGNGEEVAAHEFNYDTASLVRGSMAWLSDSPSLPLDVEPVPDPAQIAAQGWHLYRNLFNNGRRLRDYLASHRDARQGQLTVSLGPGATLLSRLPWEYLYDGETYLCLSGNMPVSHRPHSLHTLNPRPTSLPLRVLVVAAAPEDRPAFDVDQELILLHEAVSDEIRRGAICLDVLAEPTSTMLLETAQSRPYHVIHYIGHGIHQLPQREGFLCLEDTVGRSELVSGGQLPRFLEKCLPSLVLLAGPPCAQYGVGDAFAGVAHGLLHQDVPATLSIPAGLGASSAHAFYKAFYGSLTESDPVAESLYQGRLALRQLEDQAVTAQHAFDWASPVLFQRAPDLQLIKADEEEGTCKPQTYVPPQTAAIRTAIPVMGRGTELHAARRALREDARIFYVWGSDGVGKRSFVSYLVNHLAQRPSAVLLVRCSDTVEPLSALARIADFWRLGGSDAEQQAAHLLLDARQDPFERARKAQELLGTRRLLLCFENIDRWFTAGSHSSTKIHNTIVRECLLGLITAPSKSLFFFTGARRWDELADVGSADLREVYLPLLSAGWTIQVMNELPKLRSATLAQKRAIHWHIGGHPKSLALLVGWLHTGGNLESLLGAPPVEERSTERWEAFLIDEILDHLDPGEFQILQTVALLPYPPSCTDLSELTPVTAQYAQPLINKWCELGLMEINDPDAQDAEARFSLYLPVRDSVLRRMSPEEMAELHLKAAAHCGAPFVDAARRQVLARNITAWSNDRIEWLSRDTNGILGTWLRQQTDRATLQALLVRAMAWQQHLLGAGKVEEAAQIVQTLAPVLKQQQQTDLTEALIQRTIKLSAQSGYATGIDQLAQMRLEEGPLSAALDVYRQVYASLAPQGADLQRAHVLMRAAIVQQRLGNRQDAIESFESVLQSTRRGGDKEGEAESLYRLATLHREIGNVRQALVYSQAAREHFEVFDSPSAFAAIEHEQGLILKELGHFENALECFAASLRIYRKLGDPRGITENLAEIGILLEKLGRNEMAIHVIEEALQHYDYLRGPEHSEILALLEGLYTRKQRLDEAVAKLKTAREGSRTGVTSL